jgi:hypothetical protein
LHVVCRVALRYDLALGGEQNDAVATRPSPDVPQRKSLAKQLSAAEPTRAQNAEADPVEACSSIFRLPAHQRVDCHSKIPIVWADDPHQVTVSSDQRHRG